MNSPSVAWLVTSGQTWCWNPGRLRSDPRPGPAWTFPFPGKEERRTRGAAVCSFRGQLPSPGGSKQLGGRGPLCPSLRGRTNTIKMNFMLKLNHLIGRLVLKILEPLFKKKGKKSAVCAFPWEDSGKEAQPGDVPSSSELGDF